MQIAVIGGGVYGRGGKSILLALAMQEMQRAHVRDAINYRHPLVVIDECEHLERMDMIAKEEESPHPGERHRETVNRVNSKRSRAGKAARWH